MRLRLALLIALAASPFLAAHEGHDREPGRPTYQDVEQGGSMYRVGFAFVPHDPLAGEELRLELRFVELPSPEQTHASLRPLDPRSAQLRVVTADRSSVLTPPTEPAGTPGTSRARLRFDRPGTYTVIAAADTPRDPVSATFFINVSAGPLRRTTLLFDAAVVLLLLGVAGMMRRRAMVNGHLVPGRVIVAGAASVAALTVAHTLIGPAIGRALLPERTPVAIDWSAAPEQHAGAAGEPSHSRPQDEPPPGADVGAAGAPVPGDVVATIIPAPGAVADVVVPVASRVILDKGTRLGAMVRAGQTLATLEHRYILHDAVHLINARWPLVTKMFEDRRAMLAAELLALRLRDMQRAGALPAWVAQNAEGAAAEARIEFDRARKLLAMHDAQISESDPVRRPLEAPISGTIDAVSFVQGQLAYENDKLFTIVDLSNLWVEMRVPERVAATFRPPERMAFTSAALPGRRLEGTLARVADQVDPSSRTIAYFFRVSNPSRRLRIGMQLSPIIDDHAATIGESPVKPAAFDRTVADGDREPQRFTATGTLRPNPALVAQATAPLWGRIAFGERRLNVGDSVRKGEVLANVILELSIDERYLMEARGEEIAAELELAKVRQAQAEQQHRDAQSQVGGAASGAFRREEVELAQRILAAASEEEAFLTKQKEAYRGTVRRRDPKVTPVPAPIAGVVTEVGFRPGELNTTGEFRRLFTIVDTSQVWIEAQVFEHQSALLSDGFKRAWFTPATGGAPVALGRPMAVAASVDSQTRTVRVIFQTANPGGRLKLGGSGQVTVEWN